MDKKIIIECDALFVASAAKDPRDQIAEITGEFITQGEDRLYDTPFSFDLSAVWAINKSENEGYSCIRSVGGDYTVKIEFEEMIELFKECKHVGTESEVRKYNKDY